MDLRQIPEYTEALTGNEDVFILHNGKYGRTKLYKLLSVTPLSVEPNPLAFTATMVDYQQIDLSWTNGADNYILERQLDVDAWVEIYSGALGVFSDTGLLSSEHYYYRLKAQRATFYDSEFELADATTDVAP